MALLGFRRHGLQKLGVGLLQTRYAPGGLLKLGKVPLPVLLVLLRGLLELPLLLPQLAVPPAAALRGRLELPEPRGLGGLAGPVAGVAGQPVLEEPRRGLLLAQPPQQLLRRLLGLGPPAQALLDLALLGPVLARGVLELGGGLLAPPLEASRLAAARVQKLGVQLLLLGMAPLCLLQGRRLLAETLMLRLLRLDALDVRRDLLLQAAGLRAQLLQLAAVLLLHLAQLLAGAARAGDRVAQLLPGRLQLRLELPPQPVTLGAAAQFLALQTPYRRLVGLQRSPRCCCLANGLRMHLREASPLLTGLLTPHPEPLALLEVHSGLVLKPAHSSLQTLQLVHVRAVGTRAAVACDLGYQLGAGTHVRRMGLVVAPRQDVGLLRSGLGCRTYRLGEGALLPDSGLRGISVLPRKLHVLRRLRDRGL
mmetsp:Transcript_47813/g.104206  ORF Transcript_47813/g.104206 Transcript_47813/m.104206 type:complete len:422 (+) Transcript_47813:1653-2918(+)